jgi:hypothetical protein
VAEYVCRVLISRGGGERSGSSIVLRRPYVGQLIHVAIDKTGERISGVVESVREGDGIYDYFVVCEQADS